ncbi:ABC transporter permease [Alicyclobacillus ferrooxydans]|uniref:ABC-2 type transporter transmembrane domain-containing protein n=1 Tax=Alicyclobacillus ferrooxydans TaxID=471514 RepID=A0A0P9GR41_9BACL|nr:ABC transporter permease [Alicyclobacillus ferrooxydans]KPV43368.1 hypothetical protein AN477_13085 [Alicyclobacillus ferrooxydans]
MIRLSFSIALIQWKQLIRDRRAFIMLIAFPVMLTSILSFALGGLFSGTTHQISKVAVVNEDRGAAGAQLVDYLRQQTGFVRVVDVSNAAEALNEVNQGQVDGALVIPRSFTSETGQGKTVALPVEVTSAHSFTRDLVNQLVSSYGLELADVQYLKTIATQSPAMKSPVTNSALNNAGSTGATSAGATSAGATSAGATSTGAASTGAASTGATSTGATSTGATSTNSTGGLAPTTGKAASSSSVVSQGTSPAVTFINSMSNLRPVTAGSYYAIGMMVMFLLSNAISRATSMVQERRGDRYKRLLAAPVGHVTLAIGQWLATFLIMLVQGAILLLCSRFILQIQLGPVGQTALVLAGYAASVAGISTLLGSTIRSVQVVNGLASIGANIAAVLGGSIFPIYGFPQMMQWIAQVLPNGQALTRLVDSVMGVSTAELWIPVFYLVFVGIFLGTLGGIRYGAPSRKGV